MHPKKFHRPAVSKAIGLILQSCFTAAAMWLAGQDHVLRFGW